MLLGVAALLLVAGPIADAEPSSRPRIDRYMLSVGIDKYANLGDAHRLNGAVNDTERVTEALKPLGFGYARVLKDEGATRDAIRAAWKEILSELARRPTVSPPAWVFFHFSGHGSQVPDQPPGDPDRDEKDGWDETIVPSDATPDDPNSDIRDDELFHFIEGVTRGGRAKIFVLLDCCHSGSGARGETAFRIYRREQPDLAEPAARTTGAIFDERTLPAGSVVLSACRATELEPEYPDSTGPETKTYGLLSYFFAKVLAEERIRSRISNGSLRDSVEHLYLGARGVYAPPTPQVEASPRTLLSETFLDLGPEFNREPYFIVDLGEGGLGQMQAGVLQGIVKGSVYRVHGKPEDADVSRGPEAKGVGWLRIEEVDGPISRVKAVAGPGPRAGGVDWPRGVVRGYAVEHARMPGDFLLRVKVVRAERCEQADWADSPPLGAADLPAAVARAFEKPADPGQDGVRSIEDRREPWLRLVTAADEPADLLVRYTGDLAALFPVTGLARAQADGEGRGMAPACLRGGYGPFDLSDETAAATLRDYLRRIVRARNLGRLAAFRSGRDLKVGIELMKVISQDCGAPVKTEPWPRDATTGEYRPMKPGEMYALRLANRGDSTAYVTVAVVQPNQKIGVMFPRQPGGLVFEENAIRANDTLFSMIYRSAPPPGVRTVAYLVTDQPHNFTLVGQEALSITREGGKNNVRLPEQMGMADRADPGGGTLGQALLSEMALRAERVAILVDDPSWGSGLLRWVAVEEVPDDKEREP